MHEELRLSRRERQIMDVVYGLGQATAAEVWKKLPDPPTKTAVRTMLRILEDRGVLTHKRNGREFVYQPTRARRRAGQSALQRVLRTFFDGSIEKAVAAYLTDRSASASVQELERLRRLIEEAAEKE
ncbi:MAG: BlaI/MecI/CopY family transcriptional regulator [Phycisphaeraceae bacterium]|nr:BlaI/MecI/CopY family transcriptional regulator [Phycisphaeraceae bacterium]